MATIQTQVGPQILQNGATITARAERTGGTVVQDAHGRYQEAIYQGNVYSLSIAAASPTVFSGGAGGTPTLGIWNPSGSGKNCVLLAVGVAIHASGSGAGQAVVQLWAGPTAALSGTMVTPVNALTYAASGSIARGISNAAATNSTALTNNFPLKEYYWATAAGAYGTAPAIVDVAGLVFASPGTLVALGITNVPTSVTLDAFLMWEEVTQ
jgi:hypothetical protein